MPCGRWGGKGAGWEAGAVSSTATEDDGGLDHGDESGMLLRQNRRDQETERMEGSKEGEMRPGDGWWCCSPARGHRSGTGEGEEGWRWRTYFGMIWTGHLCPLICILMPSASSVMI